MITRSRIDTTKNPNIPAVQQYMAARYESEAAVATTANQINRLQRRYKGIKDEDIYVEYVRTPVALSETFLACFSVPRLGYAILDAKIAYVTFEEVLDYFKVPVQKVATYTDLVQRIRSGQTSVLFNVESGSGQLGIVIDNRLTREQKYNKISAALGNVAFNINVNYTGETFSVSNPHIGELSVSYPGCYSYSLEVYPLEEIAIGNMYNGAGVYNGQRYYNQG